MPERLDYVDFLVIAVLIALCGYVAWKAATSRQVQTSGIERLRIERPCALTAEIA